MFDPMNEQGVVALFCSKLQASGWEIVSIGSAFPDATLRHKGVMWLAEFEYKASNFIQHEHDIRNCDIIICWNNDYPNCPIPVLELSNPTWETLLITKADPRDAEVHFWRMRCEKLEGVVARLQARIENVVTPEEREIIESSHEESMIRRRQLLRYCIDNSSFSYQQAADALGITSKTTVFNSLKWLERYGYVSVDRRTRITHVQVNGQYETFVNGG